MQHRIRLSRRRFLGTAGVAGLGLGLPVDSAGAADPVATTAARIRSCILIFYYGGPSPPPTPDPTPDAPAPGRGADGTAGPPVPRGRPLAHPPPAAPRLH